MKLSTLFLILLFATSGLAEKRRVAVTIDDLPVNSTKGDIGNRRTITKNLLRHIKKEKIPAIGFVNEGKVYIDGKRDEANVDLLRAWLDAGLELGNHTFSHMSLHDNPLEKYKADIVKGEIVTNELLAANGRKMRYFRHPYLWTGLSLDIKRELGEFLRDRGYTIAPVTIDNSEWVFARAYDVAFDKGDKKTMRRIGAEYIVYMESRFDYFERQAMKTLGREMSHILLIHANRINSDYLGKLSKMIKKRGYEYLTLEEALKDEAYRLPDNFVRRNGISWLHRWALDKGRENLVPGEPKVPEWVLKFSGLESE
jgi:peptidoglycan/xylan/chitin deacetylase (PgdA/CDA1 family)